jgi:hypothetical protein
VEVSATFGVSAADMTWNLVTFSSGLVPLTYTTPVCPYKTLNSQHTSQQAVHLYRAEAKGDAQFGISAVVKQAKLKGIHLIARILDTSKQLGTYPRLHTNNGCTVAYTTSDLCDVQSKTSLAEGVVDTWKDSVTLTVEEDDIVEVTAVFNSPQAVHQEYYQIGVSSDSLQELTPVCPQFTQGNQAVTSIFKATAATEATFTLELFSSYSLGQLSGRYELTGVTIIAKVLDPLAIAGAVFISLLRTNFVQWEECVTPLCSVALIQHL